MGNEERRKKNSIPTTTITSTLTSSPTKPRNETMRDILERARALEKKVTMYASDAVVVSSMKHDLETKEEDDTNREGKGNVPAAITFNAVAPSTIFTTLTTSTQNDATNTADLELHQKIANLEKENETYLLEIDDLKRRLTSPTRTSLLHDLATAQDALRQKDEYIEKMEAALRKATQLLRQQKLKREMMMMASSATTSTTPTRRSTFIDHRTPLSASLTNAYRQHRTAASPSAFSSTTQHYIAKARKIAFQSAETDKRISPYGTPSWRRHTNGLAREQRTPFSISTSPSRLFSSPGRKSGYNGTASHRP